MTDTDVPLMPALMFTGLVVAVVGCLGAPRIAPMVGKFDVTPAAAQWTLTAARASVSPR